MEVIIKNHSFLFLVITIISSSVAVVTLPTASRRPFFPSSSSSSSSAAAAVLPRSSSFGIDSGGRWDLVQPNIGVSSMHMQLLHNNKVLIFDRTDMGPSNLSVPAEYCVRTRLNTTDCTAHSLLYDIASNQIRPLKVLTDTWCSSGAVLPNGSVVQTGGFLAGERVVRMFTPCNDSVLCNWIEFPSYLSSRRWYATNQVLPDGRIIIIGGRRAFTYEFYPRYNSLPADFFLRFLVETRDKNEENNLYPFVHLLPDGNLFVFANNRSILLDYKNNWVVREFPVLPGNSRRNYPSTGSSVLLPIRLNQGNNVTNVEVMVCGGAPTGAFIFSDGLNPKIFVEASRSCGRIDITQTEPEWVMETMPGPRVMSDMLLLPTGEVILINGATNGTAGWEDANGAAFNPFLYLPDGNPTQRFTILNPTKIARMYHSTAVLLPDGRILVGGSNPHRTYNFTAYPYPTELSLEAYHPPYLHAQYDRVRPTILNVEPAGTVSYGTAFSVTFGVALYVPDREVTVRLLAPSFTTHSFAMNQRMVVLHVAGLQQLSMFAYRVNVLGPAYATVAPPGYYLMFVVHAGIPSTGVWVNVM